MKAAKPLIAVVGAGRMGMGIAVAFAYAGYRVDLIDCKRRLPAEAKAVLDMAESQITASIASLGLALGLDNSMESKILSRIRYYNGLHMAEPLGLADVVFEAVPEVMEVKQTIFAQINSLAPQKALVASTTSTFLVDTLAEYVDNPGRFMNTHWLNPAYLIPVVEVSFGNSTSRDAVDRMVNLLEAAGKAPVKCKASPGFIVPRIQALAMNEAARLVEEGVASVQDIDKASRLGFGLRFAILGLLEFIDWGGGDILYYAGNYLGQELGQERFFPPEIIKANMAKGKIGMKTGQGFYDFSRLDLTQYQLETIKKFVALLGHLGLFRPPA